MFTLARETGWPESFILWELPFARALQYHHCALRSNGVWTIPMGESAAPADLAALATLEKQAADMAADDAALFDFL